MNRAIAGLVAALALTLVPAHAASAAAQAGDPSYHKPVVGECRDMVLADVYPHSNTTPVIDCAETHTSKVIAVAMLPSDRTWANTDVARQAKIIYNKCYPALAETLGQSEKVREMTAFTTAWFIPTKAERAAGARWLRCDLILAAGTELADLPYDAAPMLPAPPSPDSVARCLKGKTFYTTTCATGHAFRATGAFTINQAKYPTDKQFQRAGLRRCPALVTSSTYRWSWPGALHWKAGGHLVVCYTKTTS